MSPPLFCSNGHDDSLMLLHAMNPENKGGTDLNFFVRNKELIPSQPKINHASNDLSLDVMSFFLKSSILLLKTTSPPCSRYLS